MYALPNKTQHKLIVKVRGGISQKLDNFTSASASLAASSGSSSSHLQSPSSPSTSQLSSFTSKSLRRESATAVDRSGDSAAECIAELSNLPQPVFHSINQQGSKQRYHARKQYITPEHNEMIKYVQQSWKGVERDYKKSVNNVINSLDLNGSSETSSNSYGKQKHLNAKKKILTASTPLLLTGSYHHTSGTKDASSSRQDSFQPFDLEAFWGNRILKRLTEEL